MIGPGPAPDPAARKLRKLWDGHRRRPFPAPAVEDPRLQEVALYESWLGSVVESALASGGVLSAEHRDLVQARRAEGNQVIWAVGGELGEPVRSHVARLIAIEDLLADLPDR